MAQLSQFSFKLPRDLLDAARKRTSNLSEYIRSLMELDLGRDTHARDYPRTPYIYHARLLDVLDGDTLQLEIDMGFEISGRITARLEQINAPEIDTAAGKRARDFIARRLKGAHLVVETKRRGKFGRYLAKVFYHKTRKDYREILQYGSLINDDMIQAGHAKASP
jgi:endonuclease YncB( thermonuclease family)